MTHKQLETQGATLLLGAPGSGKTQTLLEAATAFIEQGKDPARLLVLTPSRVSATRFREALSARITATVSTAPVRAWQAYAFDLLRRAHIEGYLPHLDFTPKLLSGPEQDVLIKELLDGHRSGEGSGIIWPDDLREALETRGFRHEVRDFFDRMAEYDLTASAVADLAQRFDRPEWRALAKLYTEYRQVRALRAPHAFDPAALIHEATKTLLAHPDVLSAERARFDMVLIDDVQELTPSIYRLLAVLTGRSAEYLRTTASNSLASVTEAESSDLDGLLASGPVVVMTCCTDTVVQGFRGASPQLATNLPDIFPSLVTEELTTSWRMAPVIAERWAELASRLPVVPRAAHRRVLTPAPQAPSEEALLPVGDDGALLNPAKAAEPDPEVQGLVVETPQQENQLLAQMILEDHLYRGRAYQRSAIIVRNGSDVTRLKRALINLGVPVQTAASITPVRDEPAVRPFLDALGLILHTRRLRASEQGQSTQAAETETEATQQSKTWGLGADLAVALLTSRLGGASSMDVRRLRQRLRAEELRAGGTRDSDALLVEALLNPQLLPTGESSSAARRLGRVLTAGDKALDQPGATAETVLWALWEASELAPFWKAQSLSGGAGADRAGRDIDAMIGLFEAAERYTDQMPGATAEQFLAYIDAQDLPMDTLAERTNHRDAVEIMTPALAAGREWDTVYIAGLQDGTWPNTTVRGSLLGTLDLVDAATGRLDTNGRSNGGGVAPGYSLLERLRSNRFDEFRMFATATSRARSRVVCTAVSSADQAPSELLDIFAPAPGGERPLTEVRRPMTLRSLVAELRQWSEAQHISPAKADAAARLLGRLADPEQTSGLNLPGAHPRSWWGLLPLSSQAPAFEGDGPVPVSPSQIEKIHRSPLDWFVAASRAEAATDASRSLGTLIHAICEDMPDGNGADLRDELHRRLPQLGLPETWESQKMVERAEGMLQKFADYVRDLKGKGRSLVGVEGSFSVLVPGPAKDALLSGRVDRIEVDQVGRFIIIDLKTGKSKPSKADLEQHPQLAAYQVALEAGAGALMQQALQHDALAQKEGEQPAKPQPNQVPVLDGLHELSGGALLLQIGGTTKSYSEQEQAPLTAESTWAVELINRAAELIAGEHLQARHTAGGPFGIGCALPDICPICSRGRAITVRPAQ
ncbi:ATP-dependent helicase [Rothia nasimurium]|uniref:ATP-dependent helicase n=1 Tax=Rothia nasimurium TaxID=85336 RepID=UPI001F19CB87|nr:ATP-dependent DNA helicase [Rothia nasimurium]